MPHVQKFCLSVSRTFPANFYELDQIDEVYMPSFLEIDARYIPNLHVAPPNHCGLTEALMDKYKVDPSQRKAWYEDDIDAYDVHIRFRESLLSKLFQANHNFTYNLGVRYVPCVNCDKSIKNEFGENLDCVEQALNQLFMDRYYYLRHKEICEAKNSRGGCIL